MILGQLTMGARQAKNAPLAVNSTFQLNTKIDISMVPGQGMTIGRRLGGSGPIAFGREERGKVATVGGFDTFCDRTIAQR